MQPNKEYTVRISFCYIFSHNNTTCIVISTELRKVDKCQQQKNYTFQITTKIE